MEFIIIRVRNFLIFFKDFKELFLEKLIRFTIYGGAFLLPLFFLPLTNNSLEFSKTILFYALVMLALIFWLIKIYLSKRINLQMQFLDIPMLLFLFVYFLASLFGLDRYQSFWGRDFMAAGSFATICFLVILYFLVSRFIKNIEQIKILFVTMLLAIFLILLAFILNLFFPCPWPLFLGNSISAFYYFLLVGLALSAVLFWLSNTKGAKILTLILGFVFFLAIFIFGSRYLLFLVILTTFLFIFLLSVKSKHFKDKFFIFLTVFLFLQVLLLLLPIASYLKIVMPVELNLPATFGWQITKAGLSDNFLLGVGPQNFDYSFYKYKPWAFNQTSFWPLGFEKNSNFWLEILNNLGVLGFLLLIIVVVKYFYRFIRRIKDFLIDSPNEQKRFLILLVSTLILIALFIYGIFSNFNFMLEYCLFLFLGLNAVFLQPLALEKNWTNKNVINIAAYLALILVLCLIYFGSKTIWAEIDVAAAFAQAYNSNEDFSHGENYFNQASQLNPARIDYKLKLANLLINKVAFLQNDKQTDQLEDLIKQISDILNSVAQRPDLKIDDYLLLQQNYSVLKDFGLPAADSLVAINEKLLGLDPNNPELYIDRALLNFDQYLLLKSGQGAVENRENLMMALLKKIKADIDKSLQLKNNYVSGYYNLGLYNHEIGDEAESLVNIERAFNLDPSQKLVALSLKKLYLNQDKVAKAIEVLNRYLEFNAQDIEVRLELAKIYKSNKELDKAEEEINKILEIQPDNAQAKEILGQLQ